MAGRRGRRMQGRLYRAVVSSEGKWAVSIRSGRQAGSIFSVPSVRRVAWSSIGAHSTRGVMPRSVHNVIVVCAALCAAPVIGPATRAVGPIRQQAPAQAVTILKPARVFDGEAIHEGWAVRVRGDRIEAAGPAAAVAAPGGTVIDLPGQTLMPGLIEGHSHVLLHPYNEASWNDQVLKESLAVRTARAVNHLRATLMAGFTTIRDLGTEGAAYADAELKAGGRAGHRSRPAHDRDHASDRGDRQLRPEGLRAAMGGAAGGRGSGRRHHRPRRARSDRSWRGLDQGLRGLSLGRARRGGAHVLHRGAEADRGHGTQQRTSGRGARDNGRGDAARDSCRR